MSTVTGFVSGPTSSGILRWTAATLDCGHKHWDLNLKPSRGKCCTCGVEQDLDRKTFKTTCCGKQAFSMTFMADAEKPQDRLLKVGDVVDCETCSSNVVIMQKLLDLDFSIVSHARFDTRFGGQYHIYRRDTTSPTGVMHVLTVPATPEFDAALTNKRIATMSPTEGRRTIY